jgi:hypothetical protein
LKISKDNVRNPLGIVALFISLIYGFASLLLGTSADKLDSVERWPLILFIVIFPFSVLYVFYKLVTEHHGKLYSPSDYKADDSFLKTLTEQELDAKLDEDVSEAVATQLVDAKENKKPIKRADIKEKISKSEDYVIKEIEKELCITPIIGIKVSTELYIFDAGYIHPHKDVTLLEVKYYSRPYISINTVREFLHRAKLAADYMPEKTNFIVALVIENESDDFDLVKDIWMKNIEKSDLDIEVRVYIGSRIFT